MDAMGDYIHYHQINYDKFGIHHINEEPSQKWDDAAATMKNELLQASELNTLLLQAQDLQTQLNDLYYPKDKKETLDSFLQTVEKTANEMLIEEFGAAAGKINMSNLSVDQTQISKALFKAVDQTRKNITLSQLKHDSSVKTIQQRMTQLLSLLDADAFKNASVLQPRIQQARSDIKTIQQLIKQDTGVGIKNTDIDILNHIILQFNRLSPIANQKGILFEWLIPFITLRSSNLAKEELSKQMKELARSSNLGQSYADIQYYDLLSSQNLEVDFKTGNLQTKTASVRNKTDVQIKFNSGSSGQLQDLNISAKNVSRLHIKLVDSTTLYRILSFSQHYNYATHYLNVVTSAKNGNKAQSNQIVMANRLTKGLILKLAAQGYDANNPAQVLVVNQGKEIKVYNLKALVYVLSQAMINGTVRKGLLSTIPDTYTINQDFEKESKEKRLNKVIQTVRDVKITASLSGNDLKKYLDLFPGMI